jgi:hypothetical protein
MRGETMRDIEYLNVSYDFIDNGAGELMLVMDAPEGEADDDNAKIVYDGKAQAMLVRSSSQIVRLPILAAEVRSMLEDGRKKILVTEMNGEEINDVYEAKLEILNAPLPIPEETFDDDAIDIADPDDYDVVVNGADEIMIVIYEREGKPELPQAFRTEDKDIMLRRNANDIILFDSLPDESFEYFTKVDKILVNEIDEDGNSVEVYDVALLEEHS